MAESGCIEGHGSEWERGHEGVVVSDHSAGGGRGEEAEEHGEGGGLLLLVETQAGAPDEAGRHPTSQASARPGACLHRCALHWITKFSISPNQSAFFLSPL